MAPIRTDHIQEGIIDLVSALMARHEPLAFDANPDHPLSQTVVRPSELAVYSGGAQGTFAGRFRDCIVSRERRILEIRSTWLVTTSLHAVARAIHGLLGGEAPARCAGEDASLVATAADKVEIVIDSVDSIRFDMKQWIDGSLAHHCDTRAFLSPTDCQGTPCGCPTSIADVKARAEASRGPRPDVRIRFRLAGAPELGIFEYQTSGWTLLTDREFNLHALLGRLAEIGGPTRCSLEIEVAECTTKLGRDVSFQRVRLREVDLSEAPDPTRRLGSSPVRPRLRTGSTASARSVREW